MGKLMLPLCTVLMSTALVSLVACFSSPLSLATQVPAAEPSKTPYWAEAYGRFYTMDAAMAQQQVPFPIVLPSYLPVSLNGRRPSPNIEGPMKEYRRAPGVQIRVIYNMGLSDGVVKAIEIRESNYPVFPPQPEFNPGLEYTEIRGKRLVKHEGNFVLGTGVIYYFSRNEIYFVLGIYGLQPVEAIKIVESMLE